MRGQTSRQTAIDNSTGTRNRKVTLFDRGNRLTIHEPTASVQRIAEDALTYDKVIPLRGKAAMYADSPVRIETTCCGAMLQNGDNGVRQFVCGGGFLLRLKAALEANGYQVKHVVEKLPADVQERMRPRRKILDKYTYRWMQREILEEALNRRRLAIGAPTGYGKGFLIDMLVRLHPKANIVITVSGLDVLQQIYTDIKPNLVNCGIMHGAIHSDKFYRVMCVSAKSLHRVTWPVDLVITDEVHEFATDHNMALLGAFHHAKFIGLSASWGERSDKAEFELEGLFGPLDINLSYDDCLKHGCLVPIEVVMHRFNMEKDPCAGFKSKTSQKRAGTWRNKQRNLLIRDIARQYGKDEQVLIMVETIEHLVRLKALLPEYECVYGHQDAGKAKWKKYYELGLLKKRTVAKEKARRLRMKIRFEKSKVLKVIATGVWKKGVDFRNLVALIRADAANSRVSDTQIPGRTSRIGTDGKKTFGRVHDIYDLFNRTVERRASSAVTHYRKKKWKVRFVQGAKFTGLVETEVTTSAKPRGRKKGDKEVQRRLFVD